MGTTVVIIGLLKVATVMGLGIGVTTGLQYFNTYKFKPKKKEKGEESDAKGESSIRDRARSFS